MRKTRASAFLATLLLLPVSAAFSTNPIPTLTPTDLNVLPALPPLDNPVPTQLPTDQACQDPAALQQIICLVNPAINIVKAAAQSNAQTLVDQERTDAYYVNKDKDDGSGFATSVEALAIADVNIAIAAGNAAYYTTATGGSIQYANANALLVSNENSARIICATDVSQACNGIPAVSLPGLPWNALP